MNFFQKLMGTTAGYFKLALDGVRLKNSSGNLLVRNTGDTGDAEITTSKVNVSGNSLVINSDAAGSGDDWSVTLARPASGMTAAVTLTLPPDDGAANQVLITDGSGNMSWSSTGDTTSCDKIDTTTLAFGTSSPEALFTTGAADVITKVEVIVDTAFDGTAPTVAIGVSGTTGKYVATTDVDLKTIGVYQVNPALVAQGTEALIATYVADTSTAGSARILVYYATPA